MSSNIAGTARVIMPILRRVMPNIIANSIIGVSPMKGPVGQIFSMRKRYGNRSPNQFPDRVRVHKEIYKKFLRINNRKTFHKPEDIKVAGYPWVNYIAGDYYSHFDCLDWCNDTFGKDGYIHFHDEFFFENQNDYTMFIMRWK